MSSAVEALEALFEVVLNRAREDDAFAEALALALRQKFEAAGRESASSPPDAAPGKPVIAKGVQNAAPGDLAKKDARAPRNVSAGSRNRLRTRRRPSEKAPGGGARKAATLPDDVSALDLPALLAQKGRRGAQDALLDGPYTMAQLKKYAAQRGLCLRGAGRRRRDLIDALIARAPIPRAEAFA